MIRTIVFKVQDNNPPMKWTKRYNASDASIIKINCREAELRSYRLASSQHLVREFMSGWLLDRFGIDTSNV